MKSKYLTNRSSNASYTRRLLQTTLSNVMDDVRQSAENSILASMEGKGLRDEKFEVIVMNHIGTSAMKLAHLPTSLRRQVMLQLKLGNFNTAKQLYDAWRRARLAPTPAAAHSENNAAAAN